MPEVINNATAIPPPPAAATSPAGASVQATPADPEIHVIPEKFYGAALKQRFEEPKLAPKPAPVNKAAPASLAPAKKPWLLIVIIGVVGVAAVGGFVFFFQDSLFQPKAAPVVVVQPPTKPVPPIAPSNLIATSTTPQSVTLSWADVASDESGYRVDRREEGQEYSPLSSLPPNSSSFLDVTASPDSVYLYRVIALNEGGESDPTEEARVVVSSLPPVLKVATLPPAGLDTDSDGVTDLEESLYGSDPGTPDTDNDGFLDGNEVFHLYNPAGQAPVRLLDSLLVKNVESPVGWTLSLPAGWTVDLADNGAKATIDSLRGEKFIVTIEDNQTKVPILDWYLVTHPQISTSQVKAYRSKGGYTGILSPDLLVTYIPWDNRVFVLTYDLNGKSFINYRTTVAMMLNSLMLSGMPKIVSTTSTSPLPFEPSATTSGVVTEPAPVAATSSGS